MRRQRRRRNKLISTVSKRFAISLSLIPRRRNSDSRAGNAGFALTRQTSLRPAKDQSSSREPIQAECLDQRLEAGFTDESLNDPWSDAPHAARPSSLRPTLQRQNDVAAVQSIVDPLLALDGLDVRRAGPVGRRYATTGHVALFRPRLGRIRLRRCAANDEYGRDRNGKQMGTMHSCRPLLETPERRDPNLREAGSLRKPWPTTGDVR